MKKKIRSANKIKMDPAAAIAMLALLIATAAVSMMVGRYSISFGDMVSILSGNYTDELESSAIVLYARTARVAAAVMIGAALAAAYAVSSRLTGGGGGGITIPSLTLRKSKKLATHWYH